MIELRKIDMSNFIDVIKLELSDQDKKMVASNMFSLAEAYADQISQPMAIYNNNQLVGFIMYDYNKEECKGYISRLMITSKDQGKGYGSFALNLVIDDLKKITDIKQIQISYHPDNEKARSSYKKVGFKETDLVVDGEVIALIEIS
jgi:diamine N-acetyltransferase